MATFTATKAYTLFVLNRLFSAIVIIEINSNGWKSKIG